MHITQTINSQNNKTFKVIDKDVTELIDFNYIIDLKRNDVKSIEKGCDCTSTQVINTKLKLKVDGSKILPVSSLVPVKLYDAGRKTYLKVVTLTVIYKDRQKEHYKFNLTVHEPK
jgi:hypothetical protein